MKLEEARDILANCIDDYVIAEYCSSCDNKESCKNDDCIFHQAIEVVLNHLTKQEKMIELLIEDLQGVGCLNMTREEIDKFYKRRIKLAEESEVNGRRN